eukprot:Gb_30665 [translate_table: standard]
MHCIFFITTREDVGTHCLKEITHPMVAKAISCLQSLPGGDIGVFCDFVVEDVIQDEDGRQPLCLVGSTLRSPYGCHAQYMAKMGSIASLVMAVIINGIDEEVRGCSSLKLWGLVMCHHTSPRAVPFPLRYACEFLIIMDLVKCDDATLYYGGMFWLLGVTPTEAQIKDIADWLLESHADLTGLSTISLADAGYLGVASLGDAVYGIAATKITSKDVLFWFRSHTTKEMKWGGAKHHLDDKNNGQRMHPRSSFKVFLEVAKRISLPWENVEMDAIHFHFKGINELSSIASLPVGEDIGKPLVHDLVFEESVETVEKLLYHALRGEEEKNVEIKLRNLAHKGRKGFQDVTGQKVVMNNFIRIQGDHKAIVQSPNSLIPPIFGSNEYTCCSEWNATMEKLTGWVGEEVIGNSVEALLTANKRTNFALVARRWQMTRTP